MNNIYNVDVTTLRTWLELGEAVIIDVREPLEHQESHIKGAVNISLSNVIDQIRQIEDLAGKQITDKKTTDKKIANKRIIMQCRVGARSMRACQLLQAEGFKHDVWNLEGGIVAWQES